MIKQGFNLIEIALAVAIIAVGMSSILVLFPVGLNASNAAAADNMIPDVADYILSYLECRTQAAWRDAAGNAGANAFVGNLKTENNFDKNDNGDDDTKWTEISRTNLESQTLSDGKILFRYKQSSKIKIDGADTEVTDFSAVIRVWKEKIPLRLRKTDNTESSEQAPDDYGVALCAEISYPAEKPYDEREKYQFRREIYNHAK